jgi:nucleoside-diphosphate-sugar epimerase
MTVLVTGGGGFLGGAIIEKLLARNETIRILARNDYPHLVDKNIECIKGDLNNLEVVRRAVSGCDLVFHVAAKPGVWGPYEAYYQTNTVGTEHIVQACQELGVGRLVYTSTPSVVHGGTHIQGADESLPYPARFETAYPETKALAEQRVLKANGEGLQTVCLRPHLIWGPGDNHLIPRIVARAKSNRLRLVGPPSPTIDSTYIDDAARAHLMAADELAGEGRCAGKAYFISQGEPWPADALINGILGAMGMAPCRRYISAKTAYRVGACLEWIYRLFRAKSEPPLTRFVAKQLSTDHWYDISAAARDFGFKPEMTIEDGLAKLTDALQQRSQE